MMAGLEGGVRSWKNGRRKVGRVNFIGCKSVQNADKVDVVKKSENFVDIIDGSSPTRALGDFIEKRDRRLSLSRTKGGGERG